MAIRQVDISVGGMTCASCQRRVERALTTIEGVSASVNYATGIAVVEAPDSVTNAELSKAVESAGYTASLAGKAVEKYGPREIRNRLIFGVALTVPVMFVSMISALQFDRWQYVVAIVTLPIATWAAQPFHGAAWVNARHRAVTMDTLVSLGVTVAYLWSLWALATTHAGMVGMRMSASLFATDESGLYFEVAASVTTLVLLGRFLEQRARAKSLEALESLVQLNPTSALVIRNGNQVSTPIDQVKVGDQLVVTTGSQIPVDSVVVEGQGHVDTSLITGESVPTAVGPGSTVIGATLLLDGALTVQATAVAGETVLSGISRLVHQAQAGKAEVTKLVDRVSAVFVPIVIVLAALTAVAWGATGHSASQAMTAAISVLVIACPCALGLATPTALLVASGRGAQLGIVIRGPHAVEASERVSVMLLDKTGTLTRGRMSVREAVVSGDEGRVWRIVHALEQTSSHPLASVLVDHAVAQGAHGGFASNVHTFAGLGIQGLVDGVPASIGSVAWLGVPEGSLSLAAQHSEQRGDSIVVVYDDARAVAVIAVSDSAAPSDVAAVARLKNLGIRPVIVSGDHLSAVASIADQMGIAEYYSDCSPQDKLERAADLQLSGEVVAMVGDGVNDAAALAKAHLSMAMGSGADVAASAADIVLMRPSVAAIVDALQLTRKAMRTIKANLIWAFGYNVAAIPLAMSGKLGPIIASGAMAFSSVFVVTNSLRLRKFTPPSH